MNYKILKSEKNMNKKLYFKRKKLLNNIVSYYEKIDNNYKENSLKKKKKTNIYKNLELSFEEFIYIYEKLEKKEINIFKHYDLEDIDKFKRKSLSLLAAEKTLLEDPVKMYLKEIGDVELLD